MASGGSVDDQRHPTVTSAQAAQPVATSAPLRPLRATFFMEQHLGHLAYARNLQDVVDLDARLEATWVGVNYDRTASRLASIQQLPGGLRSALAGRAQVVRALRRDDPEVAFFNTQVPAALAAPRLAGRPYVVASDITPRQYDRMADLYEHRLDRFRATATVKHLVNLRLFRSARRVVAWSRWCAESVIDEYGVDPGLVEVISPGVDLECWQPSSTSSTVPRVLFVGGDLERKGGHELIEAFGRLPAGSAELHLVTRSPYRPDSPDITVHRDMTPNSPELIELYRSCDIFALPSRAEAFGIAAAEACAAGLALIAPDSWGLGDMVIDGVTGLALDITDGSDLVDQLTERLGTLVADDGLRARLGASARARAESDFNAAANGLRIANLLLDVV